MEENKYYLKNTRFPKVTILGVTKLSGLETYEAMIAWRTVRWKIKLYIQVAVQSPTSRCAS